MMKPLGAYAPSGFFGFAFKPLFFAQKSSTMTATSLGYEEVAEFIASLDPVRLLELRPSARVQERVEELLRKKKEEGLNLDEQYELDRFLALEHLIALAKVRARLRLAA
jgi:hypothetical protein